VDVALAVDSDERILALYKSNLPRAETLTADLTTLFDGKLGGETTKAERAIVQSVGQCDILLGGPPCQGHSDLNNHTRRDDPKNALYLVMARAAEILRPEVVVIENVAAVQWDKNDVVARTMASLDQAGYKVHGRVVDLRRVGVPQRRLRYLLVASRVDVLDPKSILDGVGRAIRDHADRTLDWAIRDLEDVKAETTFDTASRPSPANAERIQYLFEHDVDDLPNSERPECHRDKEHTYDSMYGRLSWDKPAQTITTGFGSMGQGRYVHPSKGRTLTPHEAARLQTFPDWYDFGAKTARGVLATAIGNAVPPLLMVDLGKTIIPALVANRMTSATLAQAIGHAPTCSGTPTDRRRITSSDTPTPSSSEARARMVATRRRDTGAEQLLRRELMELGLRYRVDHAALRGVRRRTDIVFRSARVAVFVDGCFWHSCPIHGTKPKANAGWWAAKLAANAKRDRDTDAGLTDAGWEVIRVWEHESPAEAAMRIAARVRARAMSTPC
jgi:DNA (cytosine-5)-methyltransferase 1